MKMILVNSPLLAKSIDFPAPKISGSCYEKQYYCTKRWGADIFGTEMAGCSAFNGTPGKDQCNKGGTAENPAVNCLNACKVTEKSGACNKAEGCRPL